jgi:pimeloyl-ACP methyl ester carboxylesterase
MSWRLVTVPLKLLLILICAYLVWCLIAYRDIPVEQLEQKYGGSNLQQVNIDGVPMRYKVEGTGPVLVLIHSHYYDMGMWDAWVAALKDQYTLVRFDLTTHGLTGPDPKDDYSMGRTLQLLDGLLAHLNINKFSIVGSSLGGNIAFHYAAFNPQNIDNVVLINSGGMRRPKTKRNSGPIPLWVDYASYLLPTLLFDKFVNWMIVKDGVVNDELVERFHQMFRREGNRFAEFNRLRQFDVGSPETVMPQVKAPVLIQWGEDNPQLPSELATRMAAMMTGSARVETIIYPGAGHVLPLEEPQKTAQDVVAFINANGDS